MPHIGPVSGLCNYNDVLRDVAAGDIEEYEKINAEIKLLTELSSGVRSGKENGWLPLEDVESEIMG